MKQETKSFAQDRYFNGHQSSRSVDQNWNMIKDFLTTTVKANVPCKTIRSQKNLPWINKKISSLVKRRNRLHTKFKQTGSSRLQNKWKSIRREIKKEVKTAHDNYVNNMIGDLKHDPKPFWKYISSQKSDQTGIPPLKTKQGTEAESDFEKAEALNTQFSSVFTNTKFDQVPLQNSTTKMEDIKITPQGVLKILKGINPNKAMGPDEIHPKILKELASELSDILCHFFQQSLDKGVIPLEWKLANISPLFKKNDRSLPSNYRPVSLTCICCKLLEHIVCSNLMKYFEQNNILTDRQHAFRRNRSCESQLNTVIHDWASMLDNQKQVDIFILDFEKAFDTVPHELLKSKLHRYGVSKQSLNWISDFLDNRKQTVVVNGIKSHTADVVSGVPQGTVLGPILFLVHINDIINCVDSETRLFADDCVCYREIHSTEDCLKLQNDIDNLGKWARNWGMRFQPVKCNMMVLSNKKKNIEFNYTLEGTTLEVLDQIKYLGVTISNDLNWAKHVNNVCVKANRTLGLLKRNLKQCSQDIKLQAYISLVRPVLEYASTVWDPHQLYLQDKLEKVQNRAARFITNNYVYEPGSMTKILEKTKLEPLKNRRKQAKVILFFKGLHAGTRIPLHDLRPPKRKTRNMHSQHFVQFYARKDIFKYSFLPDTTKLWNNLPNSVIEKAIGDKEPVVMFTKLIRNTALKF
jgi:hypothetical protein